MEINAKNVLLAVLVCYISSLIFVEIIKRVALYIGVVDVPFEKRKIHKTPMPTMGGIGIFLSFLLGYMIFGEFNSLVLSIFIASFLVLLLGVLDDFTKSKENVNIPAKYKILVHVAIATIIVFYGGLELTKINIFGFVLNFTWSAPFITILLIVAIINAINLIDGLDGLCAGISSIYFATIAIIGFILNKFGGLDVLLSVLMLGSTLGYLVHNFPPAKIYMGDTGSTFLGLMIAIIALIGFKTLTLTSLFIPLLILSIPILDTIFAIIRRKLKGESVSTPDKEHIHHQLLKKFSKTTSLLVIYGIDILFSITSILYVLGYKTEMAVCYIILLFLLIFFIFKTNILFEWKNQRKYKSVN